MKERPILFNDAMVRAILAGTKTQTRRIAKPKRSIEPMTDECPYGLEGDRLWVREAWRAMAEHNASRPLDIPWRSPVIYEASRHPDTGFGKLRPSIHMPRWASRITLGVTAVRVERLQEISEADAIAEGVEAAPMSMVACYSSGAVLDDQPHRRAYADLWESINGPGSWDANPWVWVIEFKRAGGGNG